MTIKDRFVPDIDVYNLPCIVILDDPVEMHQYKNVLNFISNDVNQDVYKMPYHTACIQKDLDGNDSFIIVFGKRS